ncbi:hypothetical protein PJI16_09750 [Nitrospira sp. MA-1]|nr:hypothetical protein [Nitrospira sp. MA-1]
MRRIRGAAIRCISRQGGSALAFRPGSLGGVWERTDFQGFVLEGNEEAIEAFYAADR